MIALCRALALAVLLVPCRAQTDQDVKFMESSPVGCFQKGFRFDRYIDNANANVTSLQACQQHCQSVATCAKFAYYAWYKECWVADVNAVELPIDSYLVVAGYRTCTSQGMQLPPRCTTELPTAAFPGSSGVASNLAWPNGKQPSNGECWPKGWQGADLPCNVVTVLDDTSAGWPGLCRQLVEMKGVNGTDCEANCRANPLCPSWQNSVYFSCWQGLGYDCFVRNNFMVRGAQRLQHGSVRVLMNLTGWQIIGLYKAFDNAAGYFPNVEDAIKLCKHVCYSDIKCQYWTYAPNFGCWVEDATQEYGPNWPLTTDSATRTTDDALDTVAGEYIQHFCPEGETGTITPTAPPVLTECAETAFRYDPVDMANQGRTVEASYQACRNRCVYTAGCNYYSYWPDGGCHITDASAQKVTAENFQVISGPKDCSSTYSSTSSGPEHWVVSVTTQPAAYEQIQHDFTTADAVHLAEIGCIIHNVDPTKLSTADLALLKAKYAEALATTIGVEASEIKEAPDNTALIGQVDLKAVSEGTDMTAWTWNQPLNSPDGSILESKLMTPAFVDHMKEATYDVLGQGHPAISGDVQIGKPEVGTIQHPLSQYMYNASQPSWWSQWWPLVVAILIVFCTLGGCIVFQMSERSSDKQRLMADSDGEELGDSAVWSQSQAEPDHVQSSYKGYQPQFAA
mmetsp:Transcript_52414/g.93945  ORF Transcript_52414/g.93945 Transcript_52414/m.93945 type:complete len:681 (-) Transcript_52414:106-2148(-)